MREKIGLYARVLGLWAFIGIFSVGTVLAPAREAKAFLPALAALALTDPAVIGAVLIAGGALAGAAAHYAPAVFTAGSVSMQGPATFARDLWQVQKFALSAGATYAVGRMETVALAVGTAGTAVYDWFKGHMADTPIINGAILASFSPPHYGMAVGDIISYNGQTFQIDRISDVDTFSQRGGTTVAQFEAAYGEFVGGSDWHTVWHYLKDMLNTGMFTAYERSADSMNGSDHVAQFWSTNFFVSSVSGVVTPPLTGGQFDPSRFAASIAPALASNPAGVAAEVDKAIAANPGAVSVPTPWTNADSQQAVAIAQAAAAGTGVAQAKAIADAHPDDAAAQLAYVAAQTAANQAAIVAQKSVVPVTPATSVPLTDTQLRAAPLATNALTDAQLRAAPVAVTLAPEAMPSAPGAPAVTALPDTPAVGDVAFWPPISDAMAGLTGDLKTHQPFASLSALPTMLDSLSAPPTAPVITFDMPAIGPVSVDLSCWDTAATLTRAALSLLVTIGLTFFVLRVWV